MQRFAFALCATLIISPVTAGAVQVANEQPDISRDSDLLERFYGMRFAQRRSCKAVSTCEEAVQIWCDGYNRADGDDDGIPCENVCGSRSQVDEIRAAIGC